MKKVLYVATVVKTHIMEFHIPYLKMLKEMGWETAVAARNDYENPEDCVIPFCDIYYDIPFERSPFYKGNLKAYKMLKRLIESGEYEIVHCHTPVGAMLARIAARKVRKNGTKVIYTAHGFHFFNGAPLVNWLLYYPVERLLSRLTDVLITINKEDYDRAKTFHAKKVLYVPGVGVDVKKFSKAEVDSEQKRAEIDIPMDAIVLMSVGELNSNKNHEIIIRALSKIRENRIHYVIAGRGELQEYLLQLTRDLNLDGQIHLLGYRTDIHELYKAADICVFPSIREGLGLAAIEGMAAGLPLIVSDNRGTRDYARSLDNAIVCKSNQVDDFVQGIRYLIDNSDVRRDMGEKNILLAQKYDIGNVVPLIREIFERL